MWGHYHLRQTMSQDREFICGDNRESFHTMRQSKELFVKKHDCERNTGINYNVKVQYKPSTCQGKVQHKPCTCHCKCSTSHAHATAKCSTSHAHATAKVQHKPCTHHGKVQHKEGSHQVKVQHKPRTMYMVDLILLEDVVLVKHWGRNMFLRIRPERGTQI